MNPKLPVVALVVAIGLSGCVDDDKSFFIRQNQAPGSGCSVGLGTGEAALWGGIFDVKPEVHAAHRFSYLMNPLVENQMLSTALEDSQPERNRIHMRRFNIELDLDGGMGNLGESSYDVTGVIDPNGTAVFAGIPVIPPQAVAQLAVAEGQQRQLTVKLRAVGDRSGDTMESSEFIFPITLCNGCIVNWQEQCPADGDTKLANNCGLPQDAPVTCCPTTAGPFCYSE